MARRYYYTKPLAAAWMLEEYGMWFQEEVRAMDGTQWRDIMRDLPREVDKLLDYDNSPSLGRYYIHPDSMGLLEPIDGDLWGDSGAIGEVNLALLGYPAIIIPGGHYFPVLKGYGRIIQRDGKPFHWPESEEV